MEQTKLMYEEPIMTVCAFETIDVVTLSEGTEGHVEPETFESIFGKV